MDAIKKSPLNNIYERFCAAVMPCITASSRVCVGLSGGVDSVVLLHLFVQLRQKIQFDLSAIHVHHGISPHADDWQDFCQRLCDQLGVAFTAQRVVLDHQAASGLEAEARAARYQQYAQQPVDFIALAHHRDDQAETLMLQLLRGAGVKGLAAMAKCRGVSGQLGHLRPLLDVDRSTIVAWAQAHNFCWIEDESNADTRYARNFLRHDFLPLLNNRYPAWRATMARSAENLAEAAELLDELAKMDAQQAIHERRLYCPYLKQLSPARARNLMRHFISLHGSRMPSQARLADMLTQIISTQHDNHLAIQHDEHVLYRYQDYVYLIKRLPVVDRLAQWQWPDEGGLYIPALGQLQIKSGVGSGIAEDKFVNINVRLRQGGEVMRPDCKRPRRRLKDLLQQSMIPAWQRERLPLIYSADILICVPGIGVACEWQAQENETAVTLDWQPEQ
jgi:tRNA(Ile)-lysidine synthase